MSYKTFQSFLYFKRNDIHGYLPSTFVIHAYSLVYRRVVNHNI